MQNHKATRALYSKIQDKNNFCRVKIYQKVEVDYKYISM